MRSWPIFFKNHSIGFPFSLFWICEISSQMWWFIPGRVVFLIWGIIVYDLILHEMALLSLTCACSSSH
jgi:hypothetical protein